MPRFAFLLNHPHDRYQDLSEDDTMAIVKDYIAWVEKATADGIYEGGYKLADGVAKTVRKSGGDIEVHDSPMAELPEVLGGLMVIRAADMEAAIALARSHPHLVHNERLEIRPIHDVE